MVIGHGCIIRLIPYPLVLCYNIVELMIKYQGEIEHE